MSVKLCVDRIEIENSVLLTESGFEIVFPSRFLPESTKQGDVLTLGIDHETTNLIKETTKAIQDLLRERDPGGDITL